MNRGPWSWLPSSADGEALLILAGLVLLVGFAMSIAGYAMRHGDVTQGRRPGILPLELAASRDAVRRITAVWGSAGVDAARRSLAVDFAWLVCYAGFLSLASIVVADGPSHGPSYGVAMSWLGLGAGAADVVENVAMLRALRDAGGVGAPVLATVAATVKWVLVLTVGLYVLFEAVI